MPKETIRTQTISFRSPPSVSGYGNAVGKKEGNGPLSQYFDYISKDDSFQEDTWEKAESAMQKKAISHAMETAKMDASALDLVFAGDLLNQCIATTYSLRNHSIPFFGLYGACSTMAESLILSSMAIDGQFADHVLAVTSSHFCAAERQYRSPLEYGGQRPQTSQWTATGASAIILSKEGKGPYITHATVGRIVDKGIRDANNMGAAMAPSAYDTIRAHFMDTGRSPKDYDLILTGDLGLLGQEIVTDFFAKDGISLKENYQDCGVLLYHLDKQDVHAGGSGCGCSAIVLSGYILKEMARGTFRDILFCGTGALHSPTSLMQGESIPGICHAVAISSRKEQEK